MVFKLVRTDAEEPNKIQLPLGTHLIGRGKFLECEDKRISRNHGHLIVTQDSIAIEALHQNPCFFTKKGSQETQVLKKSFKETLDNGDRFGLLPGAYWYEVLQCTAHTDSQATDVSQEYDTSQTTTNDNENVQECDNDKTLSEVNVNSTSVESDNENSKMLNFDLNELVDNAGRSESPSLLDQQNEPTHDPAHQSIEPALSTPDPPINNTDPPEPEPSGANQTAPESPTEPSKSPKRCHSPEEDDGVKKIKTEPVDIKQELLVKQDPDAGKAGQAGPSSNGADQAGASSADASKAPAQPAPPRERCIYGASCYRRNPAHKAQFAHPQDADWGPGARAPCPYGAACRKREPRHWTVHDHPPHALPPPPVPRTKTTKRRQNASFSESESDSEVSQADPVLTTKRARKPLPKMDDSEPEDPFASDGSDDWVPPSDYTETPDY